VFAYGKQHGQIVRGKARRFPDKVFHWVKLM